ncbi:MAG TPA: 3-isopropylmalate dehydrogenase [Thermoanaerobaculia bacterium]|nr:3-isopropylmalate dehydrogenase [Thermoanaerobaculia bacterium]
MSGGPILAILPGDGIGPEVTEAALSVLGAVMPSAVRRLRRGLIGGAAIDAAGEPLPRATLELCAGCDAVFLGAVGGPRWDGAPRRPEEGLLGLRRALGVYANLRPARDLGLPTPLRPELARGADLLVVRELQGGVYFGEPRGANAEEAWNSWRQTAAEVRAVAKVAFSLARGRRRRVASVDKANVLEASRLWRRVVTEVGRDFPEVTLEHLYVDAASFELLRNPRRFDVLLTENLFGDILSDEAAALAGSIGVLPSASLGPGPGLFEPVHGSAPDLAGRGTANPTGAILTAALLLTHALGRADLGERVERAVTAALANHRTPDLGGSARTEDVTGAVLLELGRVAG